MKVLKGNIFLLLASIIWGTAFVAQTTGMQFVGPLTFTFMRFFLGALAVIPLLITVLSGSLYSLFQYFGLDFFWLMKLHTGNFFFINLFAK